MRGLFVREFPDDEQRVYAMDGPRRWAIFDQNLSIIKELDADESLISLRFVDAFQLTPGDTDTFIMTVPGAHPVARDLDLELIANYVRTPLVPVADDVPDPLLFLPAVGDFVPGGKHELLFAGRNEWLAFDAAGAMLARRVILIEEDRAVAHATTHVENGKTYAYLVTGIADSDSSELEQFSKRIQKVSLEPVGGMSLQYDFQVIWAIDLPAYGLDENGDQSLLFFDIDGDGVDEIIAENRQRDTPEGGIFDVLELNGEPVHRSPENAMSEIAISDANGNGAPEIVALAGRDISAGSTHSGGSDLGEKGAWIIGTEFESSRFRDAYRFQVDSRFPPSVVVTCDLDGDGRDEIITAVGLPNRYSRHVETHSFGEGAVRVFDGAGRLLWEYLLPAGYPQQMVVDDVNLDGKYEILVGLDSGQIMSFSPSVSPSRSDYERLWKDMLRIREQSRSGISDEEYDLLNQTLEWKDGTGSLVPTNPTTPKPHEKRSDTPSVGVMIGSLILLVWASFPRRRRP